MRACNVLLLIMIAAKSAVAGKEADMSDLEIQRIGELSSILTLCATNAYAEDGETSLAVLDSIGELHDLIIRDDPAAKDAFGSGLINALEVHRDAAVNPPRDPGLYLAEFYNLERCAKYLEEAEALMKKWSR